MVAALYVRGREWAVRTCAAGNQEGFATAEWVVLLAIAVTAAAVIATLIFNKYQQKAQSVQP